MSFIFSAKGMTICQAKSSTRYITSRDFARIVAQSVLIAAATLYLPFILAGGSVAASSRSDQEAGAAVFHTKGCEHCHGVNGIGTEKGPDLTLVGKRRKKPEIEHQIVSGGKGMPAFGDALQPDEVKLLVDFLSAKRKAPKKQ